MLLGEVPIMKSITVVLTEDELQVLMGLIDAGVRHTGINAVMTAAPLMEKISNAVQASNVVPIKSQERTAS